jgi:hypothetical protein
MELQTPNAERQTLMGTKNASASRAFIAIIASVMMLGFGWLSDPLTASDQTSAISKILAWASLSAAAIAVLAAIYFTCRALAVREPERESGFEFPEDTSKADKTENQFHHRDTEDTKIGS